MSGEVTHVYTLLHLQAGEVEDGDPRTRHKSMAGSQSPQQQRVGPAPVGGGRHVVAAVASCCTFFLQHFSVALLGSWGCLYTFLLALVFFLLLL